MPDDRTWVGVDVGGRRKGFHFAVIDSDLRVTVGAAATPAECVEKLRSRRPTVVAVDAPSEWATAGETSRGCERRFVGERLCGIRFTPDEKSAASRTDRYFEWIEHGLELWSALLGVGVGTIECFPTAAWSAWLGCRGPETRARWTRAGIALLERHGMDGLASATNQDLRDAVAASLTARQWALHPNTIHSFDGLIVPQRGTIGAAVSA